ncbi:MAG: Rpn family recombination-promoting nuclease/putative transposase, partial [Planctomycetia bacterium]|nr:Rpn family recombination-promoting nuclease/putative transposase [Planctomycetia bacterium]
MNLVNAVLKNSNDPQIQSLEIQNPIQLKDQLLQKETILDIKAKDDQGQLFNIELQACYHVNFRERVLYYIAKVYSKELLEGDDYSKLQPVISIVFTKFPIRPNHPEILFDTFELRSKFDPDQIYTNHIKIYCIYVPDQLDEVLLQNPELYCWLKLLNYPDKTSEAEMEQIAATYPQIEEAFETAKEFLENPANQEFIEGRRKFQMVQRAITNTNLEE